MKRILLAGAVLVAAADVAAAADVPPPVAAPPPRAPTTYVPAPEAYYNWGGIYLGVNGGYDYATSTWTNLAGATVSLNPTGWAFGGTLGANFQAGAFVFGVESDLDWTNLSGSSVAICSGTGASCQTAQNYLATIRSRVGYAWDRALFFGTAGGADGNIKATVNNTNSSNEFGWTAGGGLEFAFAQNWTGKIDYLYVSLANGSSSGGLASVTLKESLFRVGLNYKFTF